jgi:endonuclease G
MKIKHLLIYLSVPLLLASCKKDLNQEPETLPPPVVITPPKPFTITEDFENAVKSTGYASGNVNIITGSWKFDGALVGNEKSDIKNGKKSVRIQGTKNDTVRNGILAMNFDVRHLQTISIKSSFTNFADNQFVSATVPVPLKASWELQFSKDGGKNYVKTGETINETDTILVNHVFKITDTSAIRFRIVNTSEYKGNTRVRLNIDDVTFSGLGESGITIGGSDTNPGDGGSNGGGTGTGNAGTPRGVTVGADAPPATGDNSNLLFGNPSSAATVSSDNFLLDLGYYVESYSKTRGTPNWVSWHLDATNTTNATSRLDNFAAYSGLPTGYFQVQSNSYSGSGFDRGHNCPSADRTSSTEANSATFLMTNMIPQAPQNNQQTWNNLEGYLRTQVTAGNEVYIIMGSYGTGGVGSLSTTTVNTIAGGNVTVPSNVWKVAVIIPAGNGDLIRAGNASAVRVIAVNTPNVNSINVDWTKYLVTVRDIEKAVGNGFNLLSALPQSVQDAIEIKKDSGI